MYASIVAAAQKDVVVFRKEHQRILGAKVIKAAPYALQILKITVETKNNRTIERCLNGKPRRSMHW